MHLRPNSLEFIWCAAYLKWQHHFLCLDSWIPWLIASFSIIFGYWINRIFHLLFRRSRIFYQLYNVHRAINNYHLINLFFMKSIFIFAICCLLINASHFDKERKKRNRHSRTHISHRLLTLQCHISLLGHHSRNGY